MAKKVILYFLGTAFFSVIITTIIFNSQNNLLQNQKWIALKRTLKVGVLGADEFLLSRSVLRNNFLDLTSFWSHHAIESKRSFSVHEGSFHFSLNPMSSLDFYLRSNDLLTGISISNNSPSFFFLANADHRYLNKNFFESTANIDENVLKFKLNGNRLEFFLNSKFVLSTTTTLPGPFKVGFRADYNGAKIGNIIIREASGEQFKGWFSFDPKEFLRVFLILFIGTLLVLEAILKVLTLVKATNTYSSFNLRFIFIFNLIAVFIIYMAFDNIFWSTHESSNQTRSISDGKSFKPTAFETLRFKIFRRLSLWLKVIKDEKLLIKSDGYPRHRVWRGPVACDSQGKGCIAYNQYDEFKKQHPHYQLCKRYLFWGTSQMLGAGATDINKTFFALTHKSFSHVKKSECTVFLNLSVVGSTAQKLLSFNRDALNDFRPHFSFINLSNNDDPKTFYSFLSELIKIKQNLGIKIILIKEANSLHTSESWLKENHLIMEKISKEQGIPLIDLHSAMLNVQRLNPGPLWWDFVHFTNLGHEFAANYLSKEIIRLTRELNNESPD